MEPSLSLTYLKIMLCALLKINILYYKPENVLFYSQDHQITKRQSEYSSGLVGKLSDRGKNLLGHISLHLYLSDCDWNLTAGCPVVVNQYIFLIRCNAIEPVIFASLQFYISFIYRKIIYSIVAVLFGLSPL